MSGQGFAELDFSREQPDSSTGKDVETPLHPTATGSLVKKLAEACDAVGGVEKKGRNQAQGYDYVKAADVAKAIRHELFSRGIVLIPNELECSTKQVTFQNAKGETRHSNEVIVKSAYVITDGLETLTMHGFGIAWDSGDKAVYKAKTGALKYFLRGLGLIPDEKDDPEVASPEDDAEYEHKFDQRTEGQRVLSDYQVRAYEAAINNKSACRTEAQIKAYIKKLGIEEVGNMQRADFNDFIKWLLNPDKKADLTEDLKASVKSLAEAKSIKSPLNFPHLFATAREKQVPEDDVKRWAYERFKIKSMSELTPLQFKEVQDWLGTLA